MIAKTDQFCDLYKIGLQSGKKYDKSHLVRFINDITYGAPQGRFKIYFKDSLLAQAGISRSELPANCVDVDYSMFNS